MVTIPNTLRPVARLQVDPTGAALEQAGQQLTRQAQIMTIEQEQEQQQLVTQQTAIAKANRDLRLSEFMAGLEEDADYDTYLKRFDEFAPKILQETAAQIADPQVQQLYLERGKADIGMYRLKVDEAARTRRNQVSAGNVVTALDSFTKQAYNARTPDDLEAIRRNAFNLLDTHAGKAFSFERTANLKIGFDEDLATGFLSNSPPSVAIPALTGKPLPPPIKLESLPEVTQEVLRIGADSPEQLDYFLRVLSIENPTGSPTIKNPKSSATGLFQFIESTAREYGINPADPYQSMEAMKQFTANNRRALASGLGREPTGAELYLAHQQGAGGALQLLQNPDRLAVDVRSKEQILKNGGTVDMTAGEFAAMWMNKYDGGNYAELAARISPAKKQTMLNKLIAESQQGLRQEINQIEQSQRLGVMVDRGVLESLATRAEGLELTESAQALRRFADVQEASVSYAAMPLQQQVDAINALRAEVQQGNTAKVDELAAYTNIMQEKQKALTQGNGWEYYAQRGVIEPMEQVTFSEQPDELAIKLQARRDSIQKVNNLENGSVRLPLFTDGELESMKAIYKQSTSEDAARVLTSFRQSLSAAELNQVARAIAPKDAKLSAALNSKPDVAARIISGDKLQGFTGASQKDINTEISNELAGYIKNPVAMTSAIDAIGAYYKGRQLERGETDEGVDSETLQEAISAILGTPETINVGGGESRIFLYEGDDGLEVNATDIEDMIRSIDNETLTQLNGGRVLLTADGMPVFAEDIKQDALFFTAADGVLGIEIGGGALYKADGTLMTLNLRELSKISKPQSPRMNNVSFSITNPGGR